MKRPAVLGQCEATIPVLRSCLACRTVLNETIRCPEAATSYRQGKATCARHLPLAAKEACVLGWPVLEGAP